MHVRVSGRCADERSSSGGFCAVCSRPWGVNLLCVHAGVGVFGGACRCGRERGRGWVGG